MHSPSGAGIFGVKPIVALLALVAVLGCSEHPDAPRRDAAAGALGFSKAELHPTVRPQDDFWHWVNGTWLDNTPIPPEWPAYGTVQMLYERTEQQLAQLVEDAAAGRGQGPVAETALVGTLYRSFMDEGAVEARAAAALAKLVADIDAVRDAADLPLAFARALRRGVATPIALDYEVDGEDPTRNLPLLWQSGLGLPDRDYYLEDREPFRTLREAYESHIARMHELAGWADGPSAARRIVALESRLAALQWSAVANRDVERILGNRFTLDELPIRAPGFDWQAFFDAVGLPAPAAVILAQDGYFAGLALLLADVPAADWRDYLRFRTLKAYARFLGAGIVAENFDFEGRTLLGQETMRTREQRAVQLVGDGLGEPLGRLYVARHFPPEAKQHLQHMIEQLRAAFAESIDALDWMSAATKAAARDKLERFSSKIGYPEQWRDYGTLELSPDDLLGNVARIRSLDHDWLLHKLTQPVDRGEWGMTPQTVNAYYRPSFNEIVFPAAMLQPPLYDPSADDAVNYGAIGAVIGHEFSHGFDDQGRKFDGEGRLRDWWTAADAEAYGARSQRLVTQFARFQPLPDVAVNGELTLGENIADLVGLTMAHRAYQRSLAGQPAAVIDGFTGEQRFFIGYARARRGKMTDALLREVLLSDPHAPDEYRVRGVLPNLPEFHAAFGVQEKDGMYLPPAERVTIW